MIKVKRDLTNEEFGRWKVICQAEDHIDPSGRHRAQWLCECSCDKRTQSLVLGEALTGERSKSCGCLQREAATISGKERKKYNTYDLLGCYGVGYTSKREEFYFDLEDYDKIKDYCWHINNQGYVIAYDFMNKSNSKYIRLHRLVMNCTDDRFDIDHIHGEETRFDNRKSNLRITTHTQNMMNCKLAKNNTSGITGVCWCKQKNKWEANIIVNGQRMARHFDEFDNAVKQRKRWENEYFGEYSYDYSQNI